MSLLCKIISFYYFLLLGVGCLFAQDYRTEWTEITKGNRMTYLNAIEADREGNILSTGNIRDTLIKTVNGETKLFAIPKGDEQFVQKVDQRGNVLFVEFLKGSFLYPAMLAVNNENVFLIPTEKYEDSERYEDRNKSIYLTRYNANGEEIWHKQIINKLPIYSSRIRLNTIAFLADHSILITGKFEDSLCFVGGEMMRPENHGGGLFAAKLSAHGDLVWQKQFNSTRGNGLIKTLVKSNGNILLLGNLTGFIIAGDDTLKNPNWMDKNCFLLELNNQGELLQLNRLADLAHCQVVEAYIDQDNHLYLSGNFYDSTNFSIAGKAQHFIYDATANSDAFLVKINSNLETEWVKTAGVEGTISGGQVKRFENRIYWEIEFEGMVDADPTVALNLIDSKANYKGFKAGRVLFTYTINGDNVAQHSLPPKTNGNFDKVLMSDLNTLYHIGQGATKEKGDKWVASSNLSKIELLGDNEKDSLLIKTCTPYTWQANGVTYTESGQYIHESENKQGEKNIQFLDLTIYKIDKSISKNGLELVAQEDQANYQWINCSAGCTVIENANRQHFNAKETGSYAVVISSKFCPSIDTSNLVSVIVQNIDPNLKGFYQAETDFYYYDFEKEHIQLDPTTVSMIPYRVGKRFGFVENGNVDRWLVQPQFEQVFAVNYDRAIVKEPNFEYGVINTQGEFIILPIHPNLFFEKGIYHGVNIYQSDTALHLPSGFETFNTHTFYDLDGNLLFAENSHEHSDFKLEDLAWFRFGTHYTIRNKKGEKVNAFEYNEEKYFIGIADNKLLFRELRNGKYHCVAYEVDGAEVFAVPSDSYRKLYQMTPDFYGVLATDGDYYFLNGVGERLNFGITSYAVGFFNSDERFYKQDEFIVRDFETNSLGLINRSGDTLLDFKYGYIGPLQEGVRFVQSEKGIDHPTQNKGERNGFINEKGELVLEAFDWTRMSAYQIGRQRKVLIQGVEMSDGLILGLKQNYETDTLETGEIVKSRIYNSYQYCYSNIAGDTVLVLPVEILAAGNFNDGLAPAINTDKKLGFINKKGEWGIQPIYEIAVAGAYPMPYVVVPYFDKGLAYIKAFKGYIDKNGIPYFEGERLQDHYNFSH